VKLAGKDVPRIGLGTNRLRTRQEDIEFVRAAVEAGIGMVDTAHLYTNGESEDAIGQAGITGRDEVIVATKGGYGGAGQGRPEVLNAQIDGSLQRLRTDVIDLYYLHRVDPETPLEESLGAIKARVDAGDIRHVGLSEVTVEQLEQARAALEIVSVQNRYNVSDRAAEDVVDACERLGIAFIPWWPLAVGRLSSAAGVLADVAERHGATSGQVALAWLLHRSPVMLPIPGTSKVAHLEENTAAAELRLSDEDLAALDGAA
jgi:aryl-alcohol dehydrogenase-like predicted oxidoreductase